MELFTMLHGIPHVRVGAIWVPVVEAISMLDALIDAGTCGAGETARHALSRVMLNWHRTGRLPEQPE